jgi:hypothetical protein
MGKMKVRCIVFIALCMLCFKAKDGNAQVVWNFYDPAAFALRGVSIPAELLVEALELKVKEKKLLDKLVEQQKTLIQKQDKQSVQTKFLYATLVEICRGVEDHIDFNWSILNEVRNEARYLKHGLYPLESEMAELEKQYETIMKYTASLARAPHFGGDGYRITFYLEMIQEMLSVVSKMQDVELKAANLKTLNEIVIDNRH